MHSDGVHVQDASVRKASFAGCGAEFADVIYGYILSGVSSDLLQLAFRPENGVVSLTNEARGFFAGNSR